MAHAMTDYDTEGDGVIRGLQFNTYDCIITGPNTFLGTIYLCALRASEEMAILQNELDLAAIYRARFVVGSTTLDRLCWNGEYYYNPNYNPGYDAIGNGCFIDQLHGQWWAFELDLGYLLPPSHVQMASQSMFQYLHQVGFVLNDQNPRKYMDMRDSGLWVGRWPNGGIPPKPILYSSESWSGVEYPVATLLFYTGQANTAVTVVSDVRNRHDGTRRSPWNEVECGDHYSRPMHAWQTLEAAAGYTFNAIKQTIGWAPKLNPNNFKGFFASVSGWGSITQAGTVNANGLLLSGTATLLPVAGQVILKQITLASTSNNATVKLNAATIPSSSSNSAGVLTIQLTSSVTVNANQTLQITVQ